MRVLVSNDDGYAAPGLAALVSDLTSLADCSVFVAAPEGERSACGHGITITGAVTAQPVSIDGATEAYAVGGSPADCVMLALTCAELFSAGTAGTGLPSQCELVLSGINRGNNLGLHAIYSGTVAAAREGSAKGVPALALSLDDFSKTADYSAAAAATLPLVRVLHAHPELRAKFAGYVLNVNFPAGATYAGYALTAQSFECTRPGFIAVPSPEGSSRRAWRNSASGGVHLDRRTGTDARAVADGFVSVSVLTLLTHVPPPGWAFASHTSSVPPAALEPLPLGCSDEAALAVLQRAALALESAGLDVLAMAPAESA